MNDPDVVVIGAGADGPATASRLAREHGLDVLILEGGPWHGNDQCPSHTPMPAGRVSTDPDDLDGKLLDEQFTHREADANDPTHGYLRVGPADHSRAPWFRNLHQNAFIWQVGAVGGTSLHYFANHPRAYPHAIDEQDHWPISYEELVPYYQLNEEVTSTQQAPMTAKEEVFIEGATNAGYPRIDTKTSRRRAGDQANAVSDPGEETPTNQPLDADYEGSFSYDDGFRGDTLVGDHFQGGSTPVDAPVREKSRKSANVSWVPRALDTNDNSDAGNVAIRPNAFVTNIETNDGIGTIEATGVTFRDSWSGSSSQTVSTDVVVLAAGCIESPRLWLNSGLPDDGWGRKGSRPTGSTGSSASTTTIPSPRSTPRTNTWTPTWGTTLQFGSTKPGVGGMEDIGMSPGLVSYADYLFRGRVQLRHPGRPRRAVGHPRLRCRRGSQAKDV